MLTKILFLNIIYMREVSYMFNKSNEPIIIKNTNFKRCTLFIMFPICEYKEEELKILNSVIFDRSMKYDTKRSIAIVNINNYCLSYKGEITYIGNNAFLEFMLSYPSYDCLKKDVLLDNLMFVKEIIFNPYLEDGVFPKNKVDEAVSLYKDYVKRVFKRYDDYYNYKNDLLIDENDYLVSSVFKDISLLDNIDSKRLYDIYMDIISKPPLVFLIGNVDVDRSKKLIKEIILDNKISNVRFKKDYFVYVRDISKKVGIYSDKCSFSTSGVFYNYKVLNMNSYRDVVLLSIVRKLLSSNDSNILFDYLRKYNDLVYRTASFSRSFGTLTLMSFTDSNNIDKVFDIYDEVMGIIADISYIDSRLLLIKEKARIDNELDKEYLDSILYKYVDEYLEYRSDSYYDVIKNITSLEVKDFIDNRLILVNKYSLVGDGNE